MKIKRALLTMLAVLLIVAALLVPTRQVKADIVHVVSIECEYTDEIEDCNGMTWYRKVCTTTYSDGSVKTTTLIQLAYWECQTCGYEPCY